MVEIIAVASLSATSANVIWAPPAQPNGVITEYEVIYSVYGDTDNITSDTVPSDETNFIIANLGKHANSWKFSFVI